MTLSGFSNSALALVAAAMFIAAAMTITGLDKRIALFTMSKIGASSRSIIIGAIVVTIVLSLVVPSATARTACVVPIMMGVIAAFKVDKHSRFSGVNDDCYRPGDQYLERWYSNFGGRKTCFLSVLSIKLSAPGILSAGLTGC